MEMEANITRDTNQIFVRLSQNWGTALLVCMAAFTLLLAILFNKINKLVYKEEDNLDLAFDAGGKVSLGLTASTIVSQWTWTATLLQSTSVGVKYGICGPFWYAAGATVQILLFSTISVKLKILAPGAKTFLQFVHWRFGLGAHKIYCVYALLTNAIVTAMLMLGAANIMTHMIDDYSTSFSIIMLTLAIGGYTMVGGLGATFYASYFNTAIMFIGILTFAYKVFLKNDHAVHVGSLQYTYDSMDGVIGPEGNYNGSYLTFYSHGGLMFGIINIIGNFGTVFMDQSYWQSSVAAKPSDGVWGFLLGGIIWFAVPFTFATTMSVAYIAIQTQYSEPLLSSDQISSGLVPLSVASHLGGHSEIIILTMILMAVTSTGSAEIIAVGSIIIYDIYMVYIKPFRSSRTSNACVLCGRSRGRMATNVDSCTCESMPSCITCQNDTENRLLSRRAVKPHYACKTHGDYREYQDLLTSKKNWCLMLIIISIIPLSLLLSVTQVSLGWVYLFMGVLIGSSVIPVTISMFSDYITPMAMIISPPLGTVTACITWLVYASTYDGGLGNFLENTGRNEAMLAGNLVSIIVGGLSCCLISAYQTRKLAWQDRLEIWNRTFDIDNPLFPWADAYKKEFNLEQSSSENGQQMPSLAEVEQKFKKVKLIAIVGGIGASIVLLIIWPLINITTFTFSFGAFSAWIYISIVWAFVGGLTVVILPLLSEILHIRKEYKMRKVQPGEIIYGLNIPEPKDQPNGFEAELSQSNSLHCIEESV